MATETELRELKRRHSAKLLQLPGVCGVGIERDDSGNLVLAVHVEANRQEAISALPTTLEGYPLKIIPSGPFKAQ